MPSKRCPRCRSLKDINENNFKKTREGFAVVCKTCSAARAQSRSQKMGEFGEKENDNPEEDDLEDLDHGELRKELGNITLERFIDALAQEEDIHSFAAFVDIAGLEGVGTRERADKLSKTIWEQLKYRFVCVTSKYYNLSD